MDPLLLKTIHLAGVIGLFTSLGASLLAGSSRKSASILHGVSLLVILLAGFAILRKPPMDQYWWMVKLGLWLFIAFAPFLAKRKYCPSFILVILTIAAGCYAAWLGIHRPF